MLTLSPIADDKRRTEAEIWSECEAMHPAVLGALLGAVVHGLCELPNVKLKHKPRMADFALWITACKSELKLKCKFDTAYSENREQAIETVIDADPVAVAVRTFMEDKAKWKGTATVLLEALGYIAGSTVTRGRHWPGAPHILSRRLRRAATFLRKVGLRLTSATAKVSQVIK